MITWCVHCRERAEWESTYTSKQRQVERLSLDVEVAINEQKKFSVSKRASKQARGRELGGITPGAGTYEEAAGAGFLTCMVQGVHAARAVTGR